MSGVALNYLSIQLNASGIQTHNGEGERGMWHILDPSGGHPSGPGPLGARVVVGRGMVHHTHVCCGHLTVMKRSEPKRVTWGNVQVNS